MVSRSKQFGYLLMPHFKTHQSRSIAALYHEHGVEHITVSSTKMAQYFSGGPWKSIHIAFPPTFRSRELIEQLLGKNRISINVSNGTHLEAIKGIKGLTAYIDIDSGYGRTGILAKNTHEIGLLITQIMNAGLNFGGFYCHNGSSYNQKSKGEILHLHNKVVQKLGWLKTHFQSTAPELIYGDTPSCSSANQFEGIDTVSAGNSIFFDCYQASLGVCTFDQIAICLACPVVEKKTNGNQVVIHGGAIHLSKDLLKVKGKSCFGRMVFLNDHGWSQPEEGNFLVGISQEHGTLQLSEKTFNMITEGDLIGILPVHSCLTADCMGEYLSFDRHVWKMMKK